MQVTEDLGIGGMERVVVTLCALVDRERFEPSVVCLREGGMLAEELAAIGVPVHVLPWRQGKGSYGSFLRLARLLRRERIDVLHTHNTNAFLDGGLASVLARTPTLVHTDHARDFPDRIRYMVAEHVMSHRAYRVVGVSEHTTANLARYERIPHRKLVTIPNGIDERHFEVPVDSRAARAELGIAGDARVVGVAARLMPQKGIEYLLRALALMHARAPHVVVVIAGEGPLEPELRRAAVELGVGERVRFLGPRRDVPRLLSLFDVMALPSVWEGLPMVVLEAMAAGCPVVASGVGGVPTAIQHGVSGLLVPPRDPERLADALFALLDDDPWRRRLADEGRRIFRERFSATAMARAYERLYDRHPD